MNSETSGTNPIVEATQASLLATKPAADASPTAPAFQTAVDELAMRPGSKRELAEMDLTPMVDLTFLLNMFFILTTSYALMQTLRIAPVKEPANETGGVNISDVNIVVRIESDSTYTVDEEPTTVENLASRMLNIKAAVGKKSVVVDCHADAQTDCMVKVIDAANAAQMEKVRIPSRLRGKI